MKKYFKDKRKEKYIPGFIITKHEFLISKKEILLLNSSDNYKMLYIIYELMFLKSSFEELLGAIHDYNTYIEPISLRVQLLDKNCIVSAAESSEIERRLSAIYKRIEKINFKEIECLRSNLKEKFPKHVWPKTQNEVY